MAAIEPLGSSLGVEGKELKSLKNTFESRYWSEFRGVHTDEAAKFYRVSWSLFHLMKESENKGLQKKLLNQFNEDLRKVGGAQEF